MMKGSGRDWLLVFLGVTAAALALVLVILVRDDATVPLFERVGSEVVSAGDDGSVGPESAADTTLPSNDGSDATTSSSGSSSTTSSTTGTGAPTTPTTPTATIPTTPTATIPTTTTTTASAATTVTTMTTTTSTTSTTLLGDGTGPVVQFLQSTEADLWETANYGGCPTQQQTAVVSAVVVDPSGIASVDLLVRIDTGGGLGFSGVLSMPEIAPNVYSILVGPFGEATLSGSNAPILLEVQASDSFFNSTLVSSSVLITLHDCAV